MMQQAAKLMRSYGDALVNLLADRDEGHGLFDKANRQSCLRLSPRSIGDLELLATGAFSPPDRFMEETDDLSHYPAGATVSHLRSVPPLRRS
jgi:sulfate adenylyltransferase